MTNSPSEACDVVVIGGGPGGSTISALLAQKGYASSCSKGAPSALPHRRIAAAAEHAAASSGSACSRRSSASACPSTAPSSISPAARPRRRPSISARHGTSRYPNAYQVRRSEFDEILFRNARRKGARRARGLPRHAMSISRDGRDVPHRRRDGPAASAPGAPASSSTRPVATRFSRNRFGIKRRNRQPQQRGDVRPFHGREAPAGQATKATSACSGSITAGSGSFRCSTAPPASARCAGRTT